MWATSSQHGFGLEQSPGQLVLALLVVLLGVGGVGGVEGLGGPLHGRTRGGGDGGGGAAGSQCSVCGAWRCCSGRAWTECDRACACVIKCVSAAASGDWREGFARVVRSSLLSEVDRDNFSLFLTGRNGLFLFVNGRIGLRRLFLELVLTRTGRIRVRVGVRAAVTVAIAVTFTVTVTVTVAVTVTVSC